MSLTREQQKKVEKAAAADTLGLPTLLALHTGMRIGEKSALRWSDIDFTERTIRVQNTYQRLIEPGTNRTYLMLGKTKTEKSSRIVPFSSRVKQWLMDWQSNKRTDDDFLFLKNRKPMEPRLLSYHFKRILKKLTKLSCIFINCDIHLRHDVWKRKEIL